ncbi:MAG: hypothetical protein MZV63_51970 [Marinilabiliales bacterium]|nr:hypothetical protein [Marinilabiliales bacterium]
MSPLLPGRKPGCQGVCGRDTCLFPTTLITPRLLEELDELKESPVNINSGDAKEISRLFFLTEFQVMVLADHVRRNGNVVTLYELALLPAFDRNTVMLMAPYISLQPSP